MIALSYKALILCDAPDCKESEEVLGTARGVDEMAFRRGVARLLRTKGWSMGPKHYCPIHEPHRGAEA
jgi:hypothetical protein